MNRELYKFPTTPHLAWLGDGAVRDDKVMSAADAEHFLSEPVTIEEKVDGANLGLSFDSSGGLRFQNRGNWIEGKLSGQWERLRGWAAEHEQRLRGAMPVHLIVFGEWCYARHSVPYDRLPDWFLAFDVYDTREQKFWSVTRRDALAAHAGISVVPTVGKGVYSMASVRELLEGRSALGSQPQEGIYLRRENDEVLLDRVKLVRPNFIQAIGEHWSKKGFVPNRLASG